MKSKYVINCYIDSYSDIITLTFYPKNPKTTIKNVLILYSSSDFMWENIFFCLLHCCCWWWRIRFNNHDFASSSIMYYQMGNKNLFYIHNNVHNKERISFIWFLRNCYTSIFEDNVSFFWYISNIYLLFVRVFLAYVC